jgi:Fe2+ transport system protein FeoA
MLQNRRQGPVIVTLRDTRIVLGRGEAHRVLIAPAER